jgi:hypothetical protein
MLALGTIAAHEPEVSANALEMRPAGLFITWVVGDEHRQQTQLRCKHLEHHRWHIACIGEEVATPAQRAQLGAKAKLIGGSATALDFVEVGTRQAEILAQDRRLDLSRETLGSIDVIERLLFELSLGPSRLAHPSAWRAQRAQVVVTERAYAGFGVDLGGRQALMPEEFLHLVDRHLPGIEQEGRDRMPQQVRVHPLDDACLTGTHSDHRLHGSDGVMRVAIAFEQVPTATCLQMRPEFLSEAGQDGHVAAGAALGMDKTNLGRVAVEMQILDADLDKLADPRAGEKQRLDHQPLTTMGSVSRLDQALDFETIEAIDASTACGGWCEGKLTAYVLDDVRGLVIAEPVPAPQTRRVANDRAQASVGLRLRRMTTPFGLIRRPGQVCTPSYPPQKVRSRRSLRNSAVSLRRTGNACATASRHTQRMATELGSLRWIPGAPARVDLGRWGEFSLRGDTTLVFQVLSFPEREVRLPLLFGGAPRLSYAFDAETGDLLLVGDEGAAIIHVELFTMNYRLVAPLERWVDPLNRGYDPGGLYRVRFEPLEDDLLLEWECGVLRVHVDGKLVWQRHYPCWAYRDTVAEGIIWYEPNETTAAPNQQRWGYCLSNGLPVPSEPEQWPGPARS